MSRPAAQGPAFLHSPRPALDHARVAEELAQAWGITGRLADAGGDRDQNLLVDGDDGTRYLLKIAQPDEDPGVLDMQLAALQHIARQDPELGVPRVVPTHTGESMHSLAGPGGGDHCLRVFGYVPGTPIAARERPASLMRELGSTLARLDRALQGFIHPRASHRLLWDLREAPSVRSGAVDIPDAGFRDRVQRILDDFCERVLPCLPALRAQVIHGDATADNVLVADTAPAIAGLIDFGDAVHAPVAQELAVAMADAPYGMDEPWAAACEVAVGFDEGLPIEEDEVALLWDMARARLALTAAVLATRAAHRAEGPGSMRGIADACRAQLDAVDRVGLRGALRDLRRALRLPESVAVGAGVAAPTDALLHAREQRLMPGLALFYPEAPIHAVAARGMWLQDADGRSYLDCYNNVPHLGHGHPHVVNAIARQSRALNTNTRYVYDSVTEYAERLVQSLPAGLDTVLFVNSGSEANDLAWQLATAWTGHAGALVTAGAYHGITAATESLSPQHGGTARHVRTFRPAACTTGPVGETGSNGPGRDLDRAIAELDDAGFGVAGLFIDPTFASDGILDPASGYIAAIFEQARGAGGLAVADEVQAGFGRLGTSWGFQRDGAAVPDIVTLGKPAANGYPLGAVVTRRAIARAFAEGHDWFSTFGGNPVACTAGLAVLDVIEREGLVEHAAATGGYLRDRLATAVAGAPVDTAVRGRGLFIGVALRDGDGGGPATGLAHGVALELRRRGILVGVEGPHADVLKIRPPMVCTRGHVDRLVDTLATVLSAHRPAAY